MEVKKVLSWDDSKFKPFDGEIARMNLGLEDEEGLLFNAMAHDLDITPQRLVREAMRFFISAYSMEPETFIEESKRTHARAVEALHFKARCLTQRHIGTKDDRR